MPLSRATHPTHRPPADHPPAAFVSAVLADTEDVWTARFAAAGRRYPAQQVRGISGQVDARRCGATRAQANALSVRLALQADCLAGVWAHHAQAQRQVLEPGDLEAALNAAAKIGDDALQSAAGGRESDCDTVGTAAP